MSSLQERGRDGKTQAFPLPRMVRSQREIPEVSRSWSKKQELQRSGSGKEVLLHILSVEVNGAEDISA